MNWVATIKVTFTEDVQKPGEADSQAERTVIAVLENPINANQIANAEVVAVTEQ